MKGKHSRMKSGVPLDELPIIQGWLTRESNVVEKLINKRYGALYASVFVTYRKDTDESPSKTWQITRNVTLSKVEDHTYHLRKAGTSTFWAVARGAYEKVHMWGFTVNFGSVTSGPEKLAIAFDTQDKAEEWYDAFDQAISNAAPARHQRSASTISDISNDTDMTGLHASMRSIQSFDRMPSMGDVPTSSSRKSRSWASVLHINGVAVYVEEQDPDGEGGAVMVSAVVRSPPGDVFKELVKVRKQEGLGIFVGARTLEIVDNNTQVVTQRWKATGALAGVCAPREMVLLRTWRKDEDGTYIVLYQSTTHPAVPNISSWSWSAPVRVKVQAAGFTVAPLMSQYASGVGGVPSESQECLVTLVLKANLGGYLSEQSKVGKLVSPLHNAAIRGVLEPVVTSIITIRDKVEQDRFVVRPLSMGSREIDEAPDAVRRQKLGRSTTLLAFNKESLVSQQQKVAQRPAAESLVLDAAAIGKQKPNEPTSAIDDSWAISGTCKQEYWSSPGDTGFKIRGPLYLTDRKKIPAAPPMFELIAVDLLQLEEPMMHICQYLPSVRESPAPFLFCVQMMVPSSPPRSLVASWAAPMPIMGVSAESLIAQFEEKQGACPDNVAAFFRAFTEFVDGDGPEADKRRNTKFKLIPNIAKGSWIIKQSVGTTPVILGQKLSTKYFRGQKYFEVDVDIGANSVAASITNLVCGATKTLALDMAVLIEGQSVAQLPEQLIGTVRLDKLDLQSAGYFDEHSLRVLKPEDIN